MGDPRDLSIEFAEQKATDRWRRNAEAVRRYRAQRAPEDRERHRQEERIRHRERRYHLAAPSTPMPAHRQRSEPATDVVNELDVRSTSTCVRQAQLRLETHPFDPEGEIELDLAQVMEPADSHREKQCPPSIVNTASSTRCRRKPRHMVTHRVNQ
ncbi:hypothetical protein GN244_ATG12043 [Phytophthora infestans]|uniref:Uncharacterized protein n=1 Tax=Phytophthora infestans TaxID=4787 RepID=A0A833SKC6_PHYIN|nr:hypothetical protein GN244_ATG12043 [Phytophthora infestans]